MDSASSPKVSLHQRHASLPSPSPHHSHASRAHIHAKTQSLVVWVVKIAIVLLWMLVVTTAMTLDVVMDIFQGQVASTTTTTTVAFPSKLMVTASVALHAVGLFLIALFGRIRQRHFRFYQPFVGGHTFVSMQAVGYSMGITANVVKLMLARGGSTAPANTHDPVRYGVVTVLGALAVLSQLLLVSSISYFIAPRNTSASPKRRSRVTVDFGPERAHDGELAFATLLSAIMVATSVVAEYFPSFQPINVLVMLLFTSAALVIQLRVGSTGSPSYRFFLPYVHDLKACILQVFGNTMLTLFACGGMVIFRATDASEAASWHLACGLLGSAGIGLHSMVLWMSVVGKPSGTGRNLTKSAMYGPFISTAVCLILCLVVCGMPADGAVALPMAHWAPFSSSLHLDQGLEPLRSLGILLLFALPPLTHFQGNLIFGARYAMWQPFGGSPEFVVLQASGWAAYGISLFFATLHATETEHINFLLLFAAALLLAQLCLHLSLFAFDRRRGDGSSSPPRQGSPTSPREGSPWRSEAEEMGWSLLAMLQNREMLLAIVFGLTALLMRVVCDLVSYSQARWSLSAAVPVALLLRMSTMLSGLSLPVTALGLSTRAPARVALQTTGFVALQVLAWGLYLCCAMVEMLRLLTRMRDRSSGVGVGELVGALVLGREATTASDISATYFAAHTVHGLLLSLPLLAGILSHIFLGQAQQAHELESRQVADAIEELQLLLRKQHDGEPEWREVEERSDALLRIVAGHHWPAQDATDVMKGPISTADVESSKGAARFIAALMCVASAVTFIAASFTAAQQPAVAIVFGFTGLLMTSLSCCSLQFIYGARLHHATGQYAIFMPFVGGRRFVLYQACGWSCYTIAFGLLIAAVVERQASAAMCLFMGAASVAAQLLVLQSIPLFTPGTTDSARHPSLLQRNAEGLLAVLTVVGTFFLARAYEFASEHAHQQLQDGSHQLRGEDGAAPSPLVSVILCSISVCLAIPMGLTSLQRQAERDGLTPLSLLRHGEETDSDGESDSQPISHRRSSTFSTGMASRQGTEGADSNFSSGRGGGGGVSGEVSTPASSLAPRSRPTAGRYIYAVVYAISTVLVLFVACVLPIALFVLVYGYLYEPSWSMSSVAYAYQGMMLFFALLILTPILIHHLARSHRLLRSIHSAICCWAIYSIPTYTIVGGVSPPLVVNTRGAWLFAFNMCSMACLSTLPFVHLVGFVMSIVAGAAFAHHHLYYCGYEGKAPVVVLEAISDLGCALFWVCYCRRFAGRPEMTGRLHSPAATKFFQKYFFVGMANYFKLKILRHEGPLKPLHPTQSQAVPTSSTVVDLNDPANQYIFSFHPHGVFPGTALYAPKTRLWEKTVGANDQHSICTHCADVIFSVPLMREFPLSVNARSVCRRGIENVLREGNSSMIITGGQAEMLLTKMSETEMHLVCHHKGFLRVALRHRVPLAPILSFSDSNIMDNIHCISIQRWFLKCIGFPFPVVPHGRWRLPLPTTRPITIVVGPALRPAEGREDPDDPACVEEMRIQYFECLETLFYAYREAAGYPQMRLFLHDGVDDEGEDEVVPSGGHTSSAIRRAIARTAAVKARRAAAAGGTKVKDE